MIHSERMSDARLQVKCNNFRNKNAIAQTVIVGIRQPVFVVEVSYRPLCHPSASLGMTKGRVAINLNGGT